MLDQLALPVDPQKGNPLIDHIRSVAWEYSDILADYQVGATTGVLYLRWVKGRIATPSPVSGPCKHTESTLYLQLAVSPSTSRICPWKDTKAWKGVSTTSPARPGRCERPTGSHQGIDKGCNHQ